MSTNSARRNDANGSLWYNKRMKTASMRISIRFLLLAASLAWAAACGGSIQDAFPVNGAAGADADGELSVKTGTLNANETWSGHIVIRGEAELPEGAALTIERGTRIHFDAESSPASKLIVRGELYVQGDADAPVSFIAAPRSRKWHGALMEPGSSGRFLHARFTAAKAHIRSSSVQAQFCQFENASVHAALAVEASAPLIEDCRFLGNDAAIQCDRQASPEILNNTIAGNVWGVICDNGSDAIIERNFIGNNRETGVLCRGASSPQIRSNNIARNGGYAVKDGGRLDDNFIQGNNGAHPAAVEKSLNTQGQQVNGVEEIVNARSAQHLEAGDRLFR